MHAAAALALILAAQEAPPAGEAPERRLSQCLLLARGDTAEAEAQARRWIADGGAQRARQCLGVALANQGRWADAAAAFAQAARESEAVPGERAGPMWALAGNAWLAAGEPEQARDALDLAITGGLAGTPLGEAHLDRARARMALGDKPGARADLDVALREAPGVQLAWLLSAALARRMDDPVRAASDIGEALGLAPDDPVTLLEAGNIAAMAGDEAAARRHWTRVTEVAPGSREAEAARGALAQFAAGG
ncbi:hypothetical protein ACFQ1E_07505 [Sphingomonas canadensis]|uniref:Tetratricopeptide repeat protein n=1 Tax=Sphingomonas canadensis TaxID=1219257 RepID=A0ABW3H936_9SPHN|nr:hypothetical protein [Sphingomonas canadensis]MCW3835881.1 hypothetical protein [Sphingomonas canadensis]